MSPEIPSKGGLVCANRGRVCVVFRCELVDVITELQATSPTPHHALHVIMRWEKQNRVSELHPQPQQQQLMTQEDIDDDRNNNVTHTG